MGLILPHQFTPRNYQLGFWKAMEQGCKRACLVWHRRAGKDLTALNFVITKMMQRVGIYYYLFPLLSQGRRVIWNGMDKQGLKFMDHFPKELIKTKRNDEMRVELVNGSSFQIVGSDGYDKIMGSNPCFVVFSEYSLSDPESWEYIRPILRENDGDAVFIFTPRGRNWGFDLYQTAKTSENWYNEVLTIDDTYDSEGNHVITQADVDEEIRDGMTKELARQEFMCDFTAKPEGSYYADLLDAAKLDGRIDNSWTHDPSYSTYTFWDLGIGDATSIWFVQFVGTRIIAIDYEEGVGHDLPYWLNVLEQKKSDNHYNYMQHCIPHDGGYREKQSGITYKEAGDKLGITLDVIERTPTIQLGINALRSLFPRIYFNRKNCKRGVECLYSYHKDFDNRKKTFSVKPVHDWSSNGSDALRTMAEGLNRIRTTGSFMTATRIEELENRYAARC